MDADEREIYYFLKSWHHQYIAAREISRRSGGKRRVHQNPEWAIPVLQRMVERGILETDAAGHYRIRPMPPPSKLKRWVSPAIAKILRNNSKEMAEVVLSESDIDDYYDKL